MSEEKGKGSLRGVMPLTAQFIDELRAEFAKTPMGAAYVDQLLRDGKAGKRRVWFREQGADGVVREFGCRRPAQGGR